jgi:GTP 3',8-cyclase
VQYTYQEMKADVEREFGPLQRCADPHGEVAKNFTLPGYDGSVSFVSSMTDHFCSDCNRIRLMADGNLKVCLFGANEVSLRDAMREGATDEQLRYIIGAAVRRKRKAHADVNVLAATKNRAMIKIGG